MLDYIYPFKKEITQRSSLKRYYPLELPYSVIDDRIFDLSLLFKQDPDPALTKAYKRLEYIFRTHTGIKEHSTKLFAQVFQGENAILTWDVPDSWTTPSILDMRKPHFEAASKASGLIPSR